MCSHGMSWHSRRWMLSASCCSACEGGERCKSPAWVELACAGAPTNRVRDGAMCLARSPQEAPAPVSRLPETGTLTPRVAGDLQHAPIVAAGVNVVCFLQQTVACTRSPEPRQDKSRLLHLRQRCRTMLGNQESGDRSRGRGFAILGDLLPLPQLASPESDCRRLVA